jgi:hypothetical protein
VPPAVQRQAPLAPQRVRRTALRDGPSAPKAAAALPEAALQPVAAAAARHEVVAAVAAVAVAVAVRRAAWRQE